jgi:hypothetical protein
MTPSHFSLALTIKPQNDFREGAADPKYFSSQTTLRATFRLLAAMCFCMMLAILVLFSARRANGDAERIRWKPVTLAQVKLADKTPLAFNVYQPEKKKDARFVLVLLGRRYIELDIKAKLAYNVPLAELKKNGSDLESDNFAVPARLLQTTDWTVRDVGPAEQIKLTLGDYGRLLQVDLPHPPDMRAFY